MKIKKEIISYLLAEAQNKINNKNNFILIKEGNQLQKIKFESFLKTKNLNIISENEFFNIWQNSILYEQKIILNSFKNLNEASFSDLMSMAKKGFDKAKGFISDTAKQAWDKINNFILKVFVQTIQTIGSAKKASFKALSVLLKGLKPIVSFCSQSPKLCKIVGMLAAAVFVLAVLSIFGTSEAEAAIKVGGKVVDDNVVQAAKGLASEYVRGFGVGPKERTGFAQVIELLDLVNQDPSASELPSKFFKGAEAASQMIEQAKEIMEEDPEYFKALQGIGEQINVKLNSVSESGGKVIKAFAEFDIPAADRHHSEYSPSISRKVAQSINPNK